MYKIALTILVAAGILFGVFLWMQRPSPARIQQEYAALEAAMKAEFSDGQRNEGKSADPREGWKKKWQQFAEKYPDSEQAEKAHFWILSLMRSMQDAQGVADYLRMAARLPNSPTVPAIVEASVPIYLQLYGVESTTEQLKKIADTSKVRENQAAAAVTLAYLEPDNSKRIKALERFLESYGSTKPANEARRALEEIKLIGIGAPAPAFEFTDLEGKKIALSDLRGKWVLLDFWATWCGPCAVEIPQMKLINTQFKDHPKFAMLGISLDHDKNELLARVKRERMTWPQYFDGKGWENSISRLYRVTSIPDTVLIDPEGKIQYKETPGAELKKILAEKLR
ncbi:MAG TPA: redoxin domain-containing protein [Acidobacteriota bacterium]